MRLATVRIAAIIVAATLVGCLGQQARDNALLPAIRQAQEGVMQSAARGVEEMAPGDREGAQAQLDAFSMAISEDPIPDEAIVLWSPVKALCEAGITARVASGAISEGVAESLRERVRLFDEALRKYLRMGGEG